jgi:dolichol-phosphate mannosyltransferase
MSANHNSRTNEKLVLVIPTLHESANISDLLHRVRAILDPLHLNYEIIIVDDNSQDGTEEIVNAISAVDARVRILVRKGERGLSGAILEGWQHSDANILGVMDADRQHPPELLPDLISAMNRGCDLVIGSRYTSGGELGDWNPFRKLLSTTAVLTTWPIQRSKIRAKDPMSGFFMVRRKCLERIEFQKTGFKLLLEILVRGNIQSIEEVPIVFGSRDRGESKANFKVAMDYAKLLTRLYAGKLGLYNH